MGGPQPSPLAPSRGRSREVEKSYGAFLLRHEGNTHTNYLFLRKVIESSSSTPTPRSIQSRLLAGELTFKTLVYAHTTASVQLQPSLAFQTTKFP